MKRLRFLSIALIMVILAACGENSVTESTNPIEEIIATEYETEAFENSSQEKYSYIERLNINSKREIKEIAKYERIGYLQIDGVDVLDWSFLKDVQVNLLQVLNCAVPFDASCINAQYIEQLFFSEVDLVNTEAFSTFENLTDFIIYNSFPDKRKQNLSFLSECENLSFIEIVNCNLTDLEFARSLKNLDRLTVKNASLEDISGISDCTNLVYLSLTQCRIKDIAPVTKLMKLQTLDLGDNYITDMSPLRELDAKDLYSLYLNKNFLTQVTPLGYMDTLGNIDLSKNYLTKVPMELMIEGCSVNLSYNNIRDISKEDLEYITDNNVYINVFDNLIEAKRLKEMVALTGPNQITFIETQAGWLEDEEGVAYAEKIAEVLESVQKGTEKEQVFRTVKYIMDNCKVAYDERENQDNAYGALFDGAVCTGFTDLADSIFRHLGIQTKDYHGDYGDIDNYERHVWNVVWIEGVGYHCDSMLSADGSEYPNIVLQSDNDMKRKGFTLDGLNMDKCSGSISEEEKSRLIDSL